MFIIIKWTNGFRRINGKAKKWNWCRTRNKNMNGSFWGKFEAKLRNKNKKVFREEWNVSSEFAFDFRFWVIFPEKFKTLLKHFKMASPKTLMLSLTEKALDGFDNPAASDSLFYKSWDKQFMLKSVQVNDDSTIK